jgi:hypothetical protein
MFITWRIIIVVYVIICLGIASIFFKIPKDETILVGKRDYLLKKFLANILLCLAITPIFYFVVQSLKKKK